MAAKKNKGTSQRTRINTGKKQPVQKRSSPGERAGNTAFGLAGLYSVKLEPINTIDVLKAQGEVTIDGGIGSQLLKCYNQFCKVNKITARKIEADDDLELAILVYNALYAALQRIDKNIKLNIDTYRDSTVGFTAYYWLKQTHTLYTFPLEFLAMMDQEYPQMFKPATAFLNKALYGVGFADYKNNGHLDYLLYEYDPYMHGIDEADPEQLDKVAKEVEIYLNGGVEVWLNKLRKPGRVNIEKELKSLRPRQKHYAALKKWMLEGLPILNDKNSISISSFDYNPDADNQDEFSGNERVEADRLFSIVWTADDFLWQSYEEDIQMDDQEFGAEEPIGWHPITVEQKKKFNYNTWFNTYIEWLDRGMTIIFKHIEDVKNEQSNRTNQIEIHA